MYLFALKISNMEQSFNVTDLNRVKRAPNRGSYDKQKVFTILDTHFLCHVGYVWRGQAVIIPTAYGRIEETVYLHGALKNRMLTSLVEAGQGSLTVTHTDGLVMARSIFHHSMNYRSVAVFGATRIVNEGQEKYNAVRAISDNVFQGRWDEVRQPNEAEMKATLVVAIDIEHASAKERTGHPSDDSADYDLNVWAGVIPFQVTMLPPVEDAQLAKGIHPSPIIINGIEAFNEE